MKICTFILLIAISLGLAGGVFSQNLYWVGFPDKFGTRYLVNHPEEFLSSRAIARRIKQNIAITNEDLPVSRQYLDSIELTGSTIRQQLKWLNGVVVEASPIELEKIEQLSTVSKVRLIFDSTTTSSTSDFGYLPKVSQQFTAQASTSEYGYGFEAIDMVNGISLHSLGFTGSGMIIAVIDAGFFHANQAAEIQPSFSGGRILASKDFVTAGGDLFEESEHGTNVLSLMASNDPNTFVGTAPLASYLLLRSENVQSEQIIEEYTWAAAAEFADSAGADIITSSLGYTTFDVASQNHTYSDLNGNTTPVSRACSIAASKGILVVDAAGNEGNHDWKHIDAPADSYGILAVGAVNSNLSPAYFSSHGPSADGRIKPEVADLGVNIPVVDGDGTIRVGNGTSFATPVIAGISACLWQAFPSASAQELRSAIIESSSQYNAPNNIIGFGIPNMDVAFKLLLSSQDGDKCQNIEIHPNPFFNEIYITLSHPTSPTAIVNLYTLEGKEILSQTVSVSQGIPTLLPVSKDLPTSIYIVEVECGDCRWKKKLVKQ
ncbi:MAG TPA: S8 family peptidase [Williamwhitmania sp.]|nr:S8 family peptidase [Williamwhitmania sp.]